jgi:16S rRNA (cytidine1402-2'-O)-methyltransferase
MSAAGQSKRAPAGGVLAPGLYLLATPIGNARDIGLRALDVLAGADAIAAEDTRETLKLMRLHGIALGGRPILSYNDRNGPERRPQILAWLAEGLSVAYCSDAGTPLIADPGFRLVEAARAAGFPVTAIPGPSAAVTALTLSGLPTDRFLFAGFLPPRQGPRRRALADLAAVPATLVFYESPRRLAAALADMAEVLGGGRPGAVARELTKRFEEVRRGSLAELARHYAEAGAPKGELVLLAGPPGEARPIGGAALDAALARALATQSVRDAAREVAERLGLPRREVYARALEMARK